jgi:RNA polymerase sigma-70 factor (ECF subfamily)
MMWLWENRSSLIAELTLKTLLFTIVKNKALNRITHHDVRRKVHQEIAEKYEQEFENPDTYLENELQQSFRKITSRISGII